MPAFADTLDAESVSALAEFIYQPPAQEPVWGESEITTSHLLPHPAGSLPDKPAYEADMMNLFLVVEIGDHHVTLHGGPKYSPDGRYVYFGSRDGWITKYDLYNLKVVAEVRAGINMRNITVKNDRANVRRMQTDTWKVIKTLQPAPGKVAAHVEFDRYGKKLLLSIWDEEGAVIVYDAETLEEEKRIPMNKPSGKYNVWNKINYEEGTSH